MLKLKSHFPNLSAKNLEFQNYCVLLHTFFSPFLNFANYYYQFDTIQGRLRRRSLIWKKILSVRPGGMLV